MLIMFLAIPRIVRGLGDVSFAILSLVWTVITYFTLWDLGIGRAVTKFVAERKGKKENSDVVSVVITSTVIGILLGFIFGALIFIFDYQLAHLLFTVPAGYDAIVNLALRIVAVSMPVLLLQSVFRGVVMGFDRFDMSNLVQVINGFLQWGGALVLVLLGVGVLWVIGFVMLSRLITTLILLAMISRIMNWKDLNRPFNFSLMKDVLVFGGWAMVSQVISPLLQYAERFMLSAMVATSIVTFYVVPYEATSKMLVLSVGLVSALFPAMSEMHGVGGLSQEFKKLYNQSERILVFTFLPIGAFLFIFTPEILNIWMGGPFAQSARFVFEILSVAFLLNSIAQLPFTILQAAGRSDLTGKIHLIELPIHFLFTFIAIRYLGLVGAAIATLFRIIVDTILLYAFTSRKLGLEVGVFKDFRRNLAMPALSLVGGMVCMFLLQRFVAVKVVLGLMSFLLYGFIVFRFSLEDSEKKFLMNFAQRRVSA